MKLSNMITEAPADGSLQSIWIVSDPVYDSEELGDIMFEATPEQLVFWSKGMQEDPRRLNIKFYTDQWLAKQDAKRRLNQSR